MEEKATHILLLGIFGDMLKIRLKLNEIRQTGMQTGIERARPPKILQTKVGVECDNEAI